jgi:hypothetical protein
VAEMLAEIERIKATGFDPAKSKADRYDEVLDR